MRIPVLDTMSTILSILYYLENFQHGWCDSPGTIDEVRAKLQMRQEGALKRERAIAYSRFQQVMKLSVQNT
jgi:hypothetical protein